VLELEIEIEIEDEYAHDLIGVLLRTEFRQRWKSDCGRLAGRLFHTPNYSEPDRPSCGLLLSLSDFCGEMGGSSPVAGNQIECSVTEQELPSLVTDVY
jgi:hypothetical protein